MRTRWVVASWLKATLEWGGIIAWMGGTFLWTMETTPSHADAAWWKLLLIFAPFVFGVLVFFSVLAILVLADCWDAACNTIKKQGSPIKRVTEPVMVCEGHVPRQPWQAWGSILTPEERIKRAGQIGARAVGSRAPILTEIPSIRRDF